MDDGPEHPIAEAGLAGQERKGAAPSSRSNRSRTWKKASAILIVCLVVLAALVILPVRSVARLGIDWHTVTVTVTANSSNGVGSYEFQDGAFVPSDSRCLTGPLGATYVCSDPWIAFTWYSQNGQNMAFQFYGSCEPKIGVFDCLLYDAQSTSFGGYSFICGAEPRYCAEPFYITTQNSSALGWTFQWEVLYNYTFSEPLL